MNFIKSRFSANGSKMGIALPILFIMAIVPVLFIAAEISSVTTWNSLHNGGTITEGTVVTHTIGSDEDGGNYYTISYMYASNGVDFTHNQDVTQSLFDRIKVGQSVEILYARDNPNNALLADTVSPSIDVFFYVVWYGILALIFFAFKSQAF